MDKGILSDDQIKGLRNHINLFSNMKQSFCAETMTKALNTIESQKKRIADLTAQDAPDLTMQLLSDAGINPFAVKLLCESFERMQSPEPVKFKFQGIVYHLGVNFPRSNEREPA